MTAAVCALSGEPMENPVASTKSGHLFERRVIVSYIEDQKCDPFTRETLTEADLLPIKAERRAATRTPTATSVPALLSLFQNEWDAAMLETFELKQQYQAVRAELAQALYQQDAACRVIARLIKERDDARDALRDIAGRPQADPHNVENNTEMDTETIETGYEIPQEIVTALDETQASLSTLRRKRKMPNGLVTPEEVAQMTQTGSVATPFPKSHPSVEFARVSALGDGDDRLTALSSGAGIKLVSSTNLGEVIASLQGKGAHKEAITCLEFHPQQHMILSGSNDRTVKVWSATDADSNKKWSVSDTIETEFTAGIVELAVHPSGDYAFAVSADGSWALLDLPNAAQIVRHISSAETSANFTSAALHPDGVLLATGCQNGNILIWDVKSGATVATFEGHSKPVDRLIFSENGYTLVSSAWDDGVRIWDLRKLTCVKVLHDDTNGNGVVDIAFDISGQYLAVLTVNTLSIHVTKVWTELVNVPIAGEARCVTFSDRETSAKLIVGTKKEVLTISIDSK